MRGEETSFAYKVAKTLIFNNVKKALGLDECTFFLFGAAPLDPSIRSYFLSLNFYLINSYGMSESTGPQNFTDKTSLNISSGPEAFREVGRNLPGTELVIKRAAPNDEDGEICYRGRNVFMGYFKNPEESAKTLDAEGFLHSGDNGKLTADGVLFITGRAKELIITAGGENVPPVLIENEIKSALPFLANAMVVGDMKKFLTVLLTLREDPPNSGTLDKVTLNYLADRGCKAKTVTEARSDEKLKKIISEGLKKANEKAISRAQHIQDFIVLGEDFTVENGLLTPTLKLKRKEVLKKYHDDVEKLYLKPHL
jgi:long-chain-fatty-acid--CoA ligase ACSBG